VCAGCVLPVFLLFDVFLLFCCVECCWESCVCVMCLSDVCVCVFGRCVCVGVRDVYVCGCFFLFFVFRFAVMGVVVLLACFVSVVWFRVNRDVVRFLLGFFLLLVRLLARFYGVGYVGVGLSWLRCFLVRASCWPGSSRLDWPCVMCFCIFTPLLMQVCVHTG